MARVKIFKRGKFNKTWTRNIFTGENKVDINRKCKCINVLNQTARIQECHILIGHIICKLNIFNGTA